MVLGAVGIRLFFAGQPVSTNRQWSILLAITGLALLFASPIIRVPLRQAATWRVYLGLVLCGAAILWFTVAFPAQWSPQTGQPTIISLYTVGLLIMGVGGILVPLLTDRADLEAELADLRQGIANTEADETDLAARLRELRSSQSRFEVFEDRGGERRSRLRHRNDNILADSGKSYTDRSSVWDAIGSLSGMRQIRISSNNPDSTLV